MYLLDLVIHRTCMHVIPLNVDLVFGHAHPLGVRS